MRLSVSALAIIVCASAADAQQIVGRNDRVFTLSERVGSSGRIGIFTSQGTVTVTEGSGSTVEYRGEKDNRRGDIDDIGFVVLRSGDGVTICAVYDDEDECSENGLRRERDRGRRWNERARVNITVSVPRGTILRAASGNGEVSVAAAVAEANVSSGNGRVRVSRVTGRTDVSSGNGEVTVENVGGPVEASSGNGDVTVTASNGPINASSGNGDIYASMDRLSDRGDLTFSSGNGRIEVIVPSEFNADVEASTGNGRVSTDFPITLIGRITPSRLRGTIGSGGRRLRMSTGNGSMEIRKRGSSERER
jgi:ribosome-associated translation inhibitor RaiA